MLKQSAVSLLAPPAKALLLSPFFLFFPLRSVRKSWVTSDVHSTEHTVLLQQQAAPIFHSELLK